MLAAAGLAVVLAPSKFAVPAGTVDLESTVPRQFGEWKEVPSPFVQMDLTPRRDDPTEERTTDSPYDQTVMRTYRRSDGETVMLALAYGRQQRQEVKIHRPELCYVAQGFRVDRSGRSSFAPAGGREIALTRLVTESGHRVEPVTYWIRIGHEISESAWKSRWLIFREGLAGRIPDGILVRVSTPQAKGRFDARAYEVQSEFLTELLDAMKPQARQLLTG